MIMEKEFSSIYEQTLHKLFNKGEKVEVRGQRTKELLNYSFCLQNPASNLVHIEGRKFNLMHAIAESFLLFVPEDSVESYSFMNSKMKDYSDNEVTLYGAYGKRISSSIKSCIEKLRKDKTTRQAVLNISKQDDAFSNSKDVPCTICLQFTVRNEKLNLHTYMRSNDAIWGLPYDVFVFTNLQMVVANELGLQLGNYYHNVTSLHYYNYHENMLTEMLQKEFKPVEKLNENNLNDWLTMAEIFVIISKKHKQIAFANKCYENIINAVKAKSYIVAIMKEVKHREPDSYFARNVSSFYFWHLLQEESDWLKPFTKRWYKNG